MSTISLGPNKFRVTHSEMRIVPTIRFKNLPKGVTAKVSDASKTGFTVEFEPADIPVEKFDYDASAEL